MKNCSIFMYKFGVLSLILALGSACGKKSSFAGKSALVSAQQASSEDTQQNAESSQSQDSIPSKEFVQPDNEDSVESMETEPAEQTQTDPPSTVNDPLSNPDSSDTTSTNEQDSHIETSTQTSSRPANICEGINLNTKEGLFWTGPCPVCSFREVNPMTWGAGCSQFMDPGIWARFGQPSQSNSSFGGIRNTNRSFSSESGLQIKCVGGQWVRGTATCSAGYYDWAKYGESP